MTFVVVVVVGIFCPQTFIIIIPREKGVRQTSRLADVYNRNSFMKVLQLDVFKLIHLHHFCLLKYNSSK